MPATLHQILLAPDVQPQVVEDGLNLVHQEVADKSGVSGAAVKLAYKSANAFASGYLRSIVEALIPAMADKLQPYWDDFHAAGGGQFGDYLAKRSDEVSEVLLAITDGGAAMSNRPTIVKAYKAVRGGAAKHVTAALPALGALVQKYAG